MGAMTKEYDVEVQPDFLERQTKAQPIAAVAELIWNAVDADATNVAVDVAFDPLGGMTKITITDDGHGIDYSDAPSLFKNLGGSWKKHGGQTKKAKRWLHGQEGKGRFKALALGNVAEWKTVYLKNSVPFGYTITILESDIRHLRISEERQLKTAKPGTTVVITELKRQFTSLKPENSVQELSEIFALYLKNYRDVRIAISGEAIDPAKAIASSVEKPLTPIMDESYHIHDVTLEVIQWKRSTKRALYLCNEQGFPLSQVEARFHVGDFHFSAYLKSTYVSALQQDNRLDLAELMPKLNDAVEEARRKLKEVFRERAAEKAKVVVDEWKAQNLYPYEGEAETQVERAGRQIFDIVAVTVQEAAPEFAEASHSQLALHLQMLRHAIERSPTELQKILDGVLKLPKKKQKELASLLEETDLSGIISAATLVSDRLKFLHGLRIILFDLESKKNLKERSQLHKIIEQNTWIFGEEYNLWASDRDLTTVLKVHRAKLDPEIVIDDPVKVINKARGIVDLMLSRAQRRHRQDDIEHLVIELKAPSVKLNGEHLAQIEGYALAVQEDPRFNTVEGLRWHFWLVSDAYDSFVSSRIKNGPDRLRRLIQKGDRVQIGVKTWGEILEENNARLQYLKEALEHNASDEQAIAHLQEKHREFLEGVIVEGDDEANSDEAGSPKETP
jgi:hypothetical protein